MHVLAGLLTGLLAVLLASASAAPTPVRVLEWEVVSRRPHDTAAYTQGLLLDDEGRLFESTGMWGKSDLRETDATTGEVLRRQASPPQLFSEGLARVGRELVQLSWRAGLARRFDIDSFELLGSHRYSGEGWGLCYDGERLVMSDGSAYLSFRDPYTFELTGSVRVTLDATPVARLNELECVDGAVWANVWLTDSIVRIDPADGRVTGVLDLSGVIEPDPAMADPSAVLNGIAYDPAAGTFLVTGKYWPELIEIRVSEPAQPGSTSG
jgi:glutamine cyclotransferase